VAGVFSRKGTKVQGKELPGEADRTFARLAWRALLVVLLLASCQSQPVTAEPLVGTWKDPSSRLELQADGLFILTHEDHSKSYSGSWKVLDDGRMQLDFTARGAPQTTFFHVLSVSQEQLTLKGPEGAKASFQRIG
jgi:hypothetical protein